jgi:GR25 family glycosyltransferase involved in LPS biosynthesis
MQKLFLNYGININDVTVMNYPNREDLTPEMINHIYDIDRFKELNNYIYNFSYSHESHPTLPIGLISCSYKHFLCMKNIYESNLPYGIIMEDNINITKNVPNMVNRYLSEAGDDWDIIFDGDICNLHAQNIVEDKLLYEVTRTRGLNFYILSRRGAKKLIDVLLPFSLNLDNFINIIVEEKILDLKIFWAESGMIRKIDRESTWK